MADALAPVIPNPPLLRSALSLAARGWHVFPCVPGGKRPALRGSWQDHATTEPARIRAWWSRSAYNIGIACGPSGLVVIDLDVPHDTGNSPALRAGAPCPAPTCSPLCATSTASRTRCPPTPSPPRPAAATCTTPRQAHRYGTPPGGSARTSTCAPTAATSSATAAASASAPTPPGTSARPSRCPVDRRPAHGQAPGGGRPASPARQRAGNGVRDGRAARRDPAGRHRPAGNPQRHAQPRRLQPRPARRRRAPPPLAVVSALASAAERAGLPADEARRTIRSGMAAGARCPRAPRVQHCSPARDAFRNRLASRRGSAY